MNLRELALLRFIQGKTERELALYFGRSKTAIHELLARILKNDFRHANLTKEERESIEMAKGNGLTFKIKKASRRPKNLREAFVLKFFTLKTNIRDSV